MGLEWLCRLANLFVEDEHDNAKRCNDVRV